MSRLRIPLLVSLLATAAHSAPLTDPSPSPSPITQHPTPIAAAAYRPAVITPEPQITGLPFLIGPPGDSQIMPCTATIGVTYSRLPTPPYWPWCSSPSDNETVYATTETIYHQVDCRGCLSVTVETFPTGASCEETARRSNRTARPTETDPGTTTTYETVCSPTPTPPRIANRQEGGNEEDDVEILADRPGRDDPGRDSGRDPSGRPTDLAACGTTLVVPGGPVGATVTRFLDMLTVTSWMPCGGCALKVSTRVGPMGPINMPGVTATVDVGMTTVYACLP